MGDEKLAPTDAAGDLHGDEERRYRADGNSETGETAEEEGIREENEVDKLAKSGFTEGELVAANEAQIAGDETDADGGGDDPSQCVQYFVMTSINFGLLR